MRLLTAKQAAKALRVSENTVNDYMSIMYPTDNTEKISSEYLEVIEGAIQADLAQNFSDRIANPRKYNRELDDYIYEGHYRRVRMVIRTEHTSYTSLITSNKDIVILRLCMKIKGKFYHLESISMQAILKRARQIIDTQKAS